MDSSEKFYTTAFDLKTTNEIDTVTYHLPKGEVVDRGLNVHFLKFDNQGFVLELVEASASKPGQKPSQIHHFGVDVEDIDKAFARVMAAGAELVRPIEEVRLTGLTLRHCFFKGPDGEIFELMQILEGEF